MMATKKKNLNADLDNLLAGVDLPTDEEVREETGKVKRAEANKRKASDPNIKEKLRKSNLDSRKDPVLSKNLAAGARKGGDTKASSAEYRELMTKINRKKAENPEYAENVRKGIKEKWNDPEYRAKQEKAKEIRMKPCGNSKGEQFPSRTHAAKAYGIEPRVMGNWIKKGKDGWKYL